MTDKQTRARRLKAIAHGLAVAHLQRVIDSTDWDESSEGLTQAEVAIVVRHLENIAQRLYDKEQQYKDGGVS